MPPVVLTSKVTLGWWHRLFDAAPSHPVEPQGVSWSLFVSDDLGRCQLWLMRDGERWARVNPTWESRPRTPTGIIDAAHNERVARKRGAELVRGMGR